MQYEVPLYSRSIATESGAIYLTGGYIKHLNVYLKSCHRYDEIFSTLVSVSNMQTIQYAQFRASSMLWALLLTTKSTASASNMTRRRTSGRSSTRWEYPVQESACVRSRTIICSRLVVVLTKRKLLTPLNATTSLEMSGRRSQRKWLTKLSGCRPTWDWRTKSPRMKFWFLEARAH